jgi:hypothetical protein
MVSLLVIQSTTDKRGNNIDVAYLNALQLGPQRIGNQGIPAPVARRLAATGRAVVVSDEVRYVGD